MSPALIPGTPLEMAVASLAPGFSFAPLIPAAMVLAALSVLPLIALALRSVWPSVLELVGTITVETPAEHLGGLVLDLAAAVAALRWRVTDTLLRWRTSL